LVRCNRSSLPVVFPDSCLPAIMAQAAPRSHYRQRRVQVWQAGPRFVENVARPVKSFIDGAITRRQSRSGRNTARAFDAGECQPSRLAFRFRIPSEINGLYSPHSFSLR
jgi:hypothetical protein